MTHVLALTAPAGQVDTIASTFGVDWPHLLAQIVSFVIVCAVLYAFAYGPVLKMLDERRRQIALGLANTEKINAALTGIETQRLSVLSEARAESARLVAEAREAAQRLREQDARAATAAGEEILRKAREASAQEHARLLADVRRDVGRLVVQTTTAVIGRVLTADDQRRLAEDTARHLASAPGGRTS